jgi:hypothetical protein
VEGVKLYNGLIIRYLANKGSPPWSQRYSLASKKIATFTFIKRKNVIKFKF